MNPAATLTPEHRASAPALAATLAELLVRLSALILHRLLRNPRYAPILIFLTNYIKRTGRRFARLMARAAQGTEQPRPRPATSRAAPRTENPRARPRLRLPPEKAWVLTLLKHEAAYFTNRINDILAEPGPTALLAAIPQAAGMLRPIARMLGVSHPALIPPRKPRPAARPAPATQPIPAAEPSLASDAIPLGSGLSPRPVRALCPRAAARWPFHPDTIRAGRA